MTGRTLSHYQILEQLGSGGMGEVYKARDTKLNRFVAIKVLKAEHLAQASRKQRFIQEAQAASALNHPNIVTIHEIDQRDGIDFMVMEFITGKTLDARIPRQGMRLNEALRVAVQVAEGLRRAHAAGIVHRDLKPSNIMVADDGLVKVLDFGLAKLTEQAPISQDEETRTERPETEEGTVLGTTAYMSPEQAEGRKLDERTDIFSFGVVLYEMLSGRRPFDGDSRAAMVSALLKEEPKPLENIPSDLEKVIRRCLRKDRDKRFQHVDDVKIALDEIREDSESGKFETSPPKTAAAKRWPLAAAAAAAAMALAGAGYFYWREPAKTPSQAGPVLRQITFDRGLTTEPAIWAAGNMVAYASDRSGNNLDIWLQHLETKEARRLTTHEADDREPSFSPDGSRIAFRSEREGGGIYLISTVGGTERKIASDGRTPRFSPDGNWIAYSTGSEELPLGGRLYLIPADGGTPRRLALELTGAWSAGWSPNGKWLLAWGDHGRSVDWYAVPVDGGPARKTGALAFLRKMNLTESSLSAWAEDGVIFSARSGDAMNVWRLELDPVTFQPKGEPHRLTSGNNLEMRGTAVGKRLVFASLQENADIWSLPLEPNTARITGDVQRITDDAAPNYGSGVTADGRQVVVHTQLGDATQVVMVDLARRQERLLATAQRGVNPAPRISPDGAWVAFSDLENGKSVARLIPAAGGPGRILCEACGSRNWADSKQLIVTFTGSKRVTGLMTIETGHYNPFLPYTSAPATAAPQTSRDVRWIAFYHPIDDGRTKMFVAPVRRTPVAESEWIQINEGLHWDAVPEFSPDGKTLYFFSHRDGFRCHWAMKFDPATGKRVGSPFAVQHYHSARRSPSYVRYGRVANGVAKDKIVFTMAERTGNIWMAELPQ